MKRGKQNLHRGRKIWRDRPYRRCVSSPSRTRSRRPHTGVKGEGLHCFLPTIEAEEENGVEDALACDGGGQMAMQATLDIPEPRNPRQAMESQK